MKKEIYKVVEAKVGGTGSGSSSYLLKKKKKKKTQKRGPTKNHWKLKSLLRHTLPKKYAYLKQPILKNLFVN